MDLQIDLWDVGQGDCSVIRLPDGRLLIIDTGSLLVSQLPRWLQEFDHGRSEVHALVLTHNDEDHCGCASQLIEALGKRLQQIFVVIDRGAERKGDTRQRLFRTLIRAKKRGLPVRNLALGESLAAVKIYGAIHGGHEVLIESVHPVWDSALDQVFRLHPEPNLMSAVVCLKVDGRLLVSWAGDAPLGVVAGRCVSGGEMLVGPHHGGPVDRWKGDFQSTLQAHRPKRVWISVGTDNRHEHPAAVYLDGQSRRGSHVCCSQLVHCDGARRSERKHVLQTHGPLGMMPPRNKAVYCRGAVQMKWDEDRSEWLLIFSKVITGIASPRCRHRSAAPSNLPPSRRPRGGAIRGLSIWSGDGSDFQLVDEENPRSWRGFR